MTTSKQPCTEPHCAFCLYRHAAGLLRIDSPLTFEERPACTTCARAALRYYARQQRVRASFRLGR